MAHSNGQNPYPGYGQQPPQGYGGYPQAPHNQPGSQPYPMAPGQGPGSSPPPPPVPRRGGSRVLPMIVAAGLAVGVFGGLMIVRGTGSSTAGTNSGVTVTEVIPDGGVEADAGAIAAVAIDAAPEVAVALDAAPVEPAGRQATVTLDVLPAEAAITVDGQAIDGTELVVELDGDKAKRIKIRATAPGYVTKTYTRKVREDMTVKVRLPKRRNSGGGNDSGDRDRDRDRDSDRLIDL